MLFPPFGLDKNNTQNIVDPSANEDEDSNPQIQGIMHTKHKLPSTFVPRGSKNLEAFITSLCRDLVNNLRTEPSLNDTQSKVLDLLDQLKHKPNSVLMMTDKTNSVIETNVEDYISLLQSEIDQTSTLVPRQNVQNGINDFENFLVSISHLFSPNELKFIKNSIKLKQINRPFILSKDHKPKGPDGNYPVRMILPEKNSYTYGLKKVLFTALDDKIKKSPIQFSNLLVNSFETKRKLQNLKLGSDFVFVALDIKEMFQSTTENLVRNTFDHLFESYKVDNILRNEMNTILDLMKKTRQFDFFSFKEKFYKFNGNKNTPDSLAMGWSESVTKTDAVMSVIYNKLWSTGTFKPEEVLFAQTYRDDGLVLLRGSDSYWSKNFPKWESSVRDAIRNFSLNNYEITMDYNPNFINFLDLQISKTDDFQLHFGIYKKPGQKLIYLNKESMHPPSVTKSIPYSVLHRLYSLSSSVENQKPKQIFGEYISALSNANLLTNKQKNSHFKFRESPVKKKTKKDPRKIHFVLDWCAPWWIRKPVEILKENLKRYKLNHLRISVSYSVMTSVENKIKSDTQNKLTQNLENRNFMTENCNCRNDCMLKDGKCRVSGCIYKMSCNFGDCNHHYIGSTSNFAKKRTSAHLYDSMAVYKEYKSSKTINNIDSFTKHLNRHILSLDNLSVPLLRDRILSTVIKSGLHHGYGTQSCSLCKFEKFEIFKAYRSKVKLMNSRDELLSKCRHPSKLVHLVDKNLSCH